MKNEPAAVVGTVTAIVGALLALFVEFGLDLTKGQQAAILGAAVVITPLVAGLVTRSKVTPYRGEHAAE